MMTHMSMTNESMTGESTNRKQQKENTRNNILQAALREFVEKGLADTNVQDVAKAANVSYGTIFAHFPKKDDLLIRVINEYGSQIVEKFNNLVNDENDLEKVLRADLKVIGEYEPFYAQLVSSISRLPNDARNVLIGIQSVVSHHFQRGLKKGVTNWVFKDLPGHLAFNCWTSLVYYYLSNRDLFAPGGSVIESKGDELIGFYMRMVRK